jgi:hypothetical protein
MVERLATVADNNMTGLMVLPNAINPYSTVPSSALLIEPM